MDRTTVQGHIASALAKYDRPVEDTLKRLAELEVDKAAGDEVGKVSFRKCTDRDVRVTVRVGKFVRQFFGEGLDDRSVQNIGADITAMLWSGDDGEDNDDSSGVKELEGEELRRFYLRSVSGIRSCMAHEETQSYLDIYADNPKVTKLATVRIDGHAARALIWTFPSGARYMDRIYYTSEACHAAMMRYAMRKGLGTREDIPSVRVRMKIRNGEDSNWPYIDTLCYVTVLDRHTCELSTSYGDHCCQTTDGRLNDSRERCYACGNRVEDEACVGSDDQTYCEYCYEERFFRCYACGEVYRDDDAVTVDNGARTICQHCYEHHYFTCEDCGGVYRDDDAVTVDNGDRTICQHCYEHHYFTCEDCGEVYRDDDAVTVDDGARTICQHCYEHHYFTCEDCGGDFHVDERRDGPDGTHICLNCAEQYEECSECGEVFEKDVLVDGMCSDCATDKLVEATATEEANHA